MKAKDARTSLLFSLGDRVIERFGDGANAPTQAAKIIEIKDDFCLTDTGYWYDRLTGAINLSHKVKHYQAIHSTKFKHAGDDLKGGTDA